MKPKKLSGQARNCITFIQLLYSRASFFPAKTPKKKAKQLAEFINLTSELYSIHPQAILGIELDEFGWIPFFVIPPIGSRHLSFAARLYATQTLFRKW